jgi:mRNA deadenylase 3'-5' endonuclease subunit Ccr4
MSFKAATYNVLATAYIKPEWYTGVPPDLLQPRRRVPALVRHIESLRADLVCLQEVESETFEAIDDNLQQLGFVGDYERKAGKKPDGCAMFFREGLFRLCTAQCLEYHDHERGPGSHSGFIAQMLCLEHEGHLLGIATTHLRWDRPGTRREEQIGHRQFMQLLEACERFTPACHGWLICGDFNCTPNAEIISSANQVGYQCAHANRPGVRSCVANGKARLIDYILHSSSLRAQPIDPPAIEDGTLLPSDDQPSDHLALVAEFDWA